MRHKILLGTTQIDGIVSCTYTESVNVGDGLRPGAVCAASIDFDCFGGQASAPTVGDALTYYQVADDGTETLVGTFYASATIPNKNKIQVTAYDAVSKLDVDYSTRLNAIQANFPMTVYQLVSDACSVAGVTLGSASWPMSTMSVEAFYADGLTCRNILQYAAEIAGRFVRCNTSGEVIFDWFTTAAKSIYPGGNEANKIPYRQDGLTYDNYTVLTCDAVAIRPSGTEGAAYIYPTSYGTVTATDPNGDGNVILTNITVTDDGNGNLYLNVGAEDDQSDGNVEITGSVSASNTLTLSGNLLLTNATEATYLAAAQNIYNVMSALPTYRHATVKLFSFLNPFRAGQFISMTDAQGVSFVAPVFEMTVASDGATLKSSGKETYNTDSSTVDKQLASLANNIVQIERLKVGWADIQEAIVQYLKLYGLMTVYEDDVSAAIGGHIGYGTGPSDAGNGIAITSRTPNDTWEGEVPVLEGSSAILVGETGIFLGLDYWDSVIPLWVDGGIDVNQNNFGEWIKLLSTGLVTNCPITAGGDITDGDGNVLSELAENMFYSSGDTLTHNSYVPYAGMITTSSKWVVFSVPLPKSMANISSVTVTSLVGSMRGVSGYLDGTTDETNLLSMGYTVSTTISDDRMLRILLSKTSAFTNATNNTPVTVYAKVGLSFS